MKDIASAYSAGGRRTTGRHRTARAAAGVLVAVAMGAGSAFGITGTAAATSVQPAAVSTVQAAAVRHAPVSPAHMQTRALAMLNAHRTANHLAPLKLSVDLVKVAKAWSVKMAASGDLRHNPHLASQVKNWYVVGENVGDGTNIPTLDRAFWNSPEHRANLLYKTFTQVGIGVVVDSRGTVWITIDFRQR